MTFIFRIVERIIVIALIIMMTVVLLLYIKSRSTDQDWHRSSGRLAYKEALQRETLSGR